MINRDDTINVAIQLRDTYDLPLRDAMSIAIESAFYMENQQTPATEGLGASLSLGKRILSAVKRAIDFIVRMVRELIAKFSKDASKRDNALKKIASGVSNDIYQSARGIFKDASTLINKCVTYVGILENEAAKVCSAVHNQRDADLHIPESKIDPEALADASTKVKERAEALSEHSKKMMERYAYNDMHIDFATHRTSASGAMHELRLLMLIPDSLVPDFVNSSQSLEGKVQRIGTFIDQIYKDCENGALVNDSERGAVDAWCAKVSKRLNYINTALSGINGSVSVQIRVPFTN